MPSAVVNTTELEFTISGLPQSNSIDQRDFLSQGPNLKSLLKDITDIMTFFFFGSRWWPAVLSLLKAKHEGKKKLK